MLLCLRPLVCAGGTGRTAADPGHPAGLGRCQHADLCNRHPLQPHVQQLAQQGNLGATATCGRVSVKTRLTNPNLKILRTEIKFSELLSYNRSRHLDRYV